MFCNKSHRIGLHFKAKRSAPSISTRFELIFYLSFWVISSEKRIAFAFINYLFLYYLVINYWLIFLIDWLRFIRIHKFIIDPCITGLGCSPLEVLALPDTYKKTSALPSKNSKAKKTSSNNFNKNAYPSFIHPEKQPPSSTKSQRSHRRARKKTLNPHSDHQAAVKTLCRRVPLFVKLDSQPKRYKTKLREQSKYWNRNTRRVKSRRKPRRLMCSLKRSKKSTWSYQKPLELLRKDPSGRRSISRPRGRKNWNGSMIKASKTVTSVPSQTVGKPILKRNCYRGTSSINILNFIRKLKP